MPVRTSTYNLNDSRTALYYLHVPQYTVACTAMYHLVPPCTSLYSAGTRQYTDIPVHTGMYELLIMMSVRTGMYIWILADVRCRTSDVRHRIIPKLHTMPYVVHVRHRTRTMSYVEHVQHRISMSYVRHVRHRNTMSYVHTIS
jgi:hypothetical protein